MRHWDWDLGIVFTPVFSQRHLPLSRVPVRPFGSYGTLICFAILSMVICLVWSFCSLGQMASTSPDSWPFPAPLSATRWVIIPHISFQLWSGYMNSAPLLCAPRIGKSVGTSGWCMSRDTCESKKLQTFGAFAEFWHGWRGVFADVVFHSVLFVNELNCWLSTS